MSGFSVSTSAFRAALKPSPSLLASSAWAIPSPTATTISMPPIASIGSHIQFATVWIRSWPDPLGPTLTEPGPVLIPSAAVVVIVDLLPSSSSARF